jgi:subtilisin family serine protease
LQLTQLETQSFSLTGRSISRWRIDGGRSVADTLRLIRRNFPAVTADQANKLYVGAQTEPAIKPDAVPDGAAAQYVVRKLHLLEAHRINKGDDVLVAVIDSRIDRGHPDLAGVIVDEFDAIGTPGPAHSHGAAIAGAIAANSKLVGVAPKVSSLRFALFRAAEKARKARPSISSRVLIGRRAGTPASST